MLNTGDRVLVAVSGGPDSVCLLSVLHALTKELSLMLHVAHLDHMFRGEESAKEALFVADFAERLGIPATIGKIDVPASCRERGLSAPSGAREVRYNFLRLVADKTGSSRIATGHTADDQAETFVMRLLRGAGASGLSAIPPVRDNIIRPLIDSTREEVLMYLRESGLAFVTDPSNAKPVYTRNRIRLELMPVLRQFNPRIVETLAGEAGLLRDEDEAGDGYCAILMERILEKREHDFVITRKDFNALPAAFRRRLLKKAVDLAGAGPSELSRVQIEDALAFMTGAETGRAMNLPYGLAIEREYDTFILRQRAETNEFCVQFAVPGITAIPERGMEIVTHVRDRAVEPKHPPLSGNYVWQAQFDYDKIGSLLTLRNRQSGDWFHPAGMGGHRKKIQDYFVDEKVPRGKRGAVPLLCSGENILWVVGMRTDGRFLADAETKRVLIVLVRSME